MITTLDLVEIHDSSANRRMVVVVLVGSQPENRKVPVPEGIQPLRFVGPEQLFIIEEFVLQK